MTRTALRIVALALVLGLAATAGFAADQNLAADLPLDAAVTQTEAAAVLPGGSSSLVDLDVASDAPVLTLTLDLRASVPMDFSTAGISMCTGCVPKQCFLQCGGGECTSGGCCYCW